MSNTETKLDKFGFPLKIGDTVIVAFITGRSSVSIYKDTVVGFTPKKVKLKKHGTRDNNKVVLFTHQNNYNYDVFPEYVI